MVTDRNVVIVVAVVVTAVVMYLVYRYFNMGCGSVEVPKVEETKPEQIPEEIPETKETFFQDFEPMGVTELTENVYHLDDGNNGNDTIINNVCSKSCCSPQYPTPFSNAECGKDNDKYVKSNIFCNNPYQDSGCLCLNKEQAIKMSNRGQNSSHAN